MAGRHRTRLVGWHPSDPAALAWLDAEIQRRGGGRGTQSAILDEALSEYRKQRDDPEGRAIWQAITARDIGQAHDFSDLPGHECSDACAELGG